MSVVQKDAEGFFVFPPKSPEELLDYSVDMSRYLDSAVDEIIEEFAVEIEGGDGFLVIGDGVGTDTVDTGVDDDVVVPALEFDDSSLLAWIGGGTAGQEYKVKYHFKTDVGRHGTVKLKIRVS